MKKLCIALVTVTFLFSCQPRFKYKIDLVAENGVTASDMAILNDRLLLAYGEDVRASSQNDSVVLELRNPIEFATLRLLLKNSGQLSFHRAIPLAGFLSGNPAVHDRVLKSPLENYIGPEVSLPVPLYDTSEINQALADANLPKDVRLLWGVPQDGASTLYVMDSEALITKAMVKEAKQTFDAMGRPSIAIKLKEDFHERWAEVTRKNFGRSISIVLDGVVLSSPRVAGVIPGGNAEISGLFTEEEARVFAALIGVRPSSRSFDIAHFDPLLKGTKYTPTAFQQERYDAIRARYILHESVLDSILETRPTGDQTRNMAMREFRRIRKNSLAEIVDQAQLTNEQVDLFLLQSEMVIENLAPSQDPGMEYLEYKEARSSN